MEKKILQREHIGHINLGGKIKDRYCQPNQTDFLKFLSHGKFGEKGISRGPGNVGIYTVVVYGLKPFGWCDISHGHSMGGRQLLVTCVSERDDAASQAELCILW